MNAVTLRKLEEVRLQLEAERGKVITIKPYKPPKPKYRIHVANLLQKGMNEISIMEGDGVAKNVLKEVIDYFSLYQKDEDHEMQVDLFKENVMKALKKKA